MLKFNSYLSLDERLEHEQGPVVSLPRYEESAQDDTDIVRMYKFLHQKKLKKFCNRKIIFKNYIFDFN